MSNVMDAHLLRFFKETRQLAEHHAYLKQQLQTHYLDVPNGNVQRWQAAVAELPEAHHQPDFNNPTITIGAPDDRLNLTPALQALMPWRKGPFQIHGIDIDTEWRSDWKWDRIAPHTQPLGGRQVLDIGTGNGYFLLRMLGAGADLAVGADPTLLFYHQFMAIQKLIAPNPAYLLPLAGEHLPAFNHFDTVFSLGVLYHRRSPLDHIAELLSFLRPGGELVLETLVHTDDSVILMPRDRYAQMRNVWFLPGTEALLTLMRRAGVEAPRIVDVTTTTTDEQRQTGWMTFQSLSDFLDPEDPTLTVEGYPAPTRAIAIGSKSGH